MATTESNQVGRITKPKIRFISLCPAGKNGVRTLYKSADGGPTLQVLTKAMNERGELDALIYPANQLDADNEWADPDTVRKMAHDYMAAGGQVDLRHDEQSLGDRVQFVESYIVKSGDPDWPEHEGAWAGKFRFAEGDPLRDLYRSGAWGGVSIGGTAVIERGVSPFSKAVAMTQPTPIPAKESPQMDEAQLRSLLKEDREAQSAAIAEAVAKAVSAALKPADPPAEEKPAPTLDPFDREAVQKHLQDLKRKETLAALDLTSVSALEKHLESLTPAQPKPEDKVSFMPTDLAKGNDSSIRRMADYMDSVA